MTLPSKSGSMFEFQLKQVTGFFQCIGTDTKLGLFIYLFLPLFHKGFRLLKHLSRKHPVYRMTVHCPLCPLPTQATVENNHAAHSAGWYEETFTWGFPFQTHSEFLFHMTTSKRVYSVFFSYLTQTQLILIQSLLHLSKVSVYLPSSFSCSPMFDNSYPIQLDSLFFVIIHWRERRIKREGRKWRKRKKKMDMK